MCRPTCSQSRSTLLTDADCSHTTPRISVSLSLSARFSVLFVVVEACFVSSALAVSKTNLLSDRLYSLLMQTALSLFPGFPSHFVTFTFCKAWHFAKLGFEAQSGASNMFSTWSFHLTASFTLIYRPSQLPATQAFLSKVVQVEKSFGRLLLLST